MSELIVNKFGIIQGSKQRIFETFYLHLSTYRKNNRGHVYIYPGDFQWSHVGSDSLDNGPQFSLAMRAHLRQWFLLLSFSASSARSGIWRISNSSRDHFFRISHANFGVIWTRIGQTRRILRSATPKIEIFFFLKPQIWI